MRKFLIVLLVAVCVLSGCAPKAPVELSLNARSAMIIDARNGEVLFEKNADFKSPPASTAKVMTAIIAIENAPLKRKIIPSSNAVGAEPIITGLKPGVEYSLSDLLAALLIKSANDA
ncbi:MAG: serine hydrolase, partial [Candidatus Omnitrophota bacterium]